MRVYLPLLLEELADIASTGRLPDRHGYAVTSALRAADPAADEEDLEFEAMCQALDAARSLGDGRRVIGSADVPEVPGTGDDARLDAATSVALSEVVSFHVEEEAGDEGSGYDDLLWYDVTELPELAGTTT